MACEAKIENRVGIDMVKVCHFSSAHRGLDIRIFRKECVSLAKNGFDVSLVINGDQDDVKKAKACGVKLHPLRYVSESHRLMRMFKHTFSCFRAAMAVDADIYHFHDPELIFYGLYLKWKGKVVFYDIHEDTRVQIRTKAYIPRFLRVFASKIFGMIEDAASKKFNG
jgi:hypothetical protein